MEAIGKLTGGVAHDFNNILTVIMGVTDLMRRQQTRSSPLLPRLNQVHEAANRAADLVRQLLAFSRQQVLQPTTLNLNEVVGKFEKMLRRLIGEDIEMVTRFDPELGLVKADPGQMEQVLMNLAVNARDAMPHGGALTIETANVSIDEEFARRHMGFNPGGYVMIAFTDSGIGMDAQTQKHIFEPFFTTKAKSEGTGLGLSTVYGIVNQSGGRIWVYSEPGKGTSFKIYLPEIQESVQEWEAIITPDEATGGSETILVVEDDHIVRTLVTETLTSFGYRVLQADCAENADRIIAAHHGDVEMLLTDVVIPGGESGPQMAHRLTDKMPNLKVLFMSGYTDDAIVHHGVLDPGVAFIQKPFIPMDLARKVRMTLDDSA
jgi:CheY-like chemotaxis protein/two-component sensor histidine kinase